MSLMTFDLPALKELDGGRVLTAWMQGMQRCVLDCEDRPGEETARKLTLQAEIVPVKGENGSCEGVHVQLQVKDTIPTRRSKVYSMAVRQKKGQPTLVFSTEDPSNVSQTTFADIDPDTGRIHRPTPKED